MLILLISIFAAVHTIAGFNFTYQMASQCNKEFVCSRGYIYDTSFEVDHSYKLSPGVTFEMHIAILAANNGHILLSTQPFQSDRVYEIVIGGGQNQYSQIRSNIGKFAKVSVETKGILSAVEFRAFYIRIKSDTVEVFEENATFPLLSYFDLNPITVNYFAFSSWKAEAKYLYDCPDPTVKNNDTSNISANSTEVEAALSDVNRLKKMLRSGRSMAIPPQMSINLQLQVKVISVNYNAMESKLETVLYILMRWNDENLLWDPSLFNDTDSVIFEPGEIWKPSLVAYNADKLDVLNANVEEPVYVISNGNAFYHFQARIATWCHDRSSNLSRWPRDEYQCSIMIGPWSVHERIDMKIVYSENDENITGNEIDSIIVNEWKILSIYKNIVNRNESSSTTNEPLHNLNIRIHIQRRALSHNLVFYTPLLAFITFLLLSFWTTPLEMSRIWFYAGCVVLMCMGLSYLDYFVPTHTLPSIVILYICVLLGALLALLVQAILIHPAMAPVYKSQAINTILSCQVVKMLVYSSLRPRNRLDDSNSAIYAVLEDSKLHDRTDPGISTIPRDTFQEVEGDKTTVEEKELFAELVDKLMFIVYSITIAVLLAMHF